MAVIAWRNAAEAAGVSLSASSEASGLGVQSLLTPTIGEVWRSNTGGAVTHSVGLDLGTQVPLRLFGIGAPRDGVLPGTGAAWRVRLSNVGIGSSEVLNRGSLSLDLRRGVVGLLLPAALTARYVQFSFSGVAGDPYLQLGRIWAGDALVPAKGIAFGWQRGVGDAGTIERAPVSGVSNAQRGATYRTLDFDLAYLTEDEAFALDDAGLALGTTRQAFISPLNSDFRHAMFGKFATPPPPAQPSHRLFTAHITFQEDL
ncbi:hypothetical protein [Roseomonas indoligenes]|uniref:Uncharacterized protein n=1 Tax=Roseomonas indoligenes TaxID=2820811 RepID=A0A940MXX0_9PROT|nr:hypothetical protein [Pararoseomonas indoligenes]MBP0493035.1 hypothetical protein [Pararoseomonas indoligenes]